MPGPILGVLSLDEGVLHAVESAAPGAEIEALSCLANVDPRRMDWVIVDPRAADGLCLDALADWWRQRRRPRIVFLSLPADPEILLHLPLCFPGKIARLGELQSIFWPACEKDQAPPSEARSAWENRDRILSPNGPEGKARLLLQLAQGQVRRRLSVRQVASVIGLSPRQLERLSRQSFGVTPRILLKVALLRRVLEVLTSRKDSLEEVAGLLGFPDQSALSRFVIRFLGVRPGAYRAAECRKMT